MKTIKEDNMFRLILNKIDCGLFESRNAALEYAWKVIYE